MYLLNIKKGRVVIGDLIQLRLFKGTNNQK